MVPLARRVCVAITVSFLVGCSSKATEPSEPLFTDIDVARTAWLANRPSSYSFNVTVGSQLLLGPLHVTVVGGRVVSALDARGKQDQTFTTTIDSIWSRIIAGRANGQLNSAQIQRTRRSDRN
jgi:hypothetical protein